MRRPTTAQEEGDMSSIVVQASDYDSWAATSERT
jgi:hypothetical protein